MKKETFYEKLKQENLVLTELQKQQFAEYYHLLYQYNQVMDLTNVIAEEDVYERHFFDSLTIAFQKNWNEVSLCDVGSGAGFPAIPLKIMFPQMKLTIIDSLNKRMNFLQEVVEKLQLSEVKIVPKRVEDVAEQYRNHFDIVTARAVAKLPILLELCTPLVKKSGQFIALKGSNGQEELEMSVNAMNLLYIELIHIQSFYTENGILRNNYVFFKKKETDKKYPRKYAQIKSHPL